MITARVRRSFCACMYSALYSRRRLFVFRQFLGMPAYHNARSYDGVSHRMPRLSLVVICRHSPPFEQRTGGEQEDAQRACAVSKKRVSGRGPHSSTHEIAETKTAKQFQPALKKSCHSWYSQLNPVRPRTEWMTPVSDRPPQKSKHHGHPLHSISIVRASHGSLPIAGHAAE